jgi:Na+-driven multidrug efflux pump
MTARPGSVLLSLVMISGLISLALVLFSLLFYPADPAVLYSSVEVDVMNAAKTYFWITALSFPFLGIYNSGAALYRSMNRTNTTMFVSILMNVINIVGNYIGVYILHLGVAGVAWPTLLSRMVAACHDRTLSFNAGESGLHPTGRISSPGTGQN